MNKLSRMQEILDSYSKSRLSQKKFCKEAGISSATLYNWLRRSRESSVSGFVPVVSAPSREAVHPLELEYPGGVKLRVSSADLKLLSHLIRL